MFMLGGGGVETTCWLVVLLSQRKIWRQSELILSQRVTACKNRVHTESPHPRGLG